MNKRLFLILTLTLMGVTSRAQSLEECQRAAQNNYPLINQYGLIERTTALTVDNIAKGWWPQVTATAQATLQSDVASWPSELRDMMSGMGVDLKGLKKDQYRVGIDVNQTVYDGGTINSQRAIAIEQGKVLAAQNEVNLYNVSKRVNEMYFALLLLNEQITLNNDLQKLLDGNERKLESMAKNGTAAKSDWQNVKAERLKAVQQGTDLESQKRMLQAMLTTFCGIDVKNVTKPALIVTDAQNNRPELRLFDAQLRLADAQEKALDAALKPKVSVFAQGYYGYPGYNMFHDMMSRNWTLNAMIGARVTWNIGALYTRKNDKTKLQLQRDMTLSNREVFLYNNRLDVVRLNEEIDRYRELMTNDNEIITLRTAVRKAAESKLVHGIIDVNDLVREINQENAARVQQSIHEIEMLKQIYDKKYTTNN